MRSAKRRKSVIAEGAGGCHVLNDEIPHTSTFPWQHIFAKFLTQASDTLKSPYFYLLQSNGWKSLCLLTGLDVEIYSALLLNCGLASLKRNNKLGTKSVFLESDKWNAFLQLFNLRGDRHGRGGCAEFTDGRISKAAIERTLSVGCGMIDQSADSKMMWLLRIGKIAPDEKPPSNTAINNDKVEPPGMTHKLRIAKMELAQAILHLNVVENESMMQDVWTVRNWVLMTNNTNSNIAPKRKHEVDDSSDIDGDDEEMQDRAFFMPQQQLQVQPNDNLLLSACGTTISSTIHMTTLSESTITNNYPNPVSPLNQNISDDLRKQFPTISKFCPDLLHRNRPERVVNGVDLDLQLFHAIIAESVDLCKKLDEPLQYQHSNGQHRTRLIKLLIPNSKRRRLLKPNIEKCFDEIISVLQSVNFVGDDRFDHQIVTLLVDYLAENHRSQFEKQLREKRIIPKLMNEFDIAALVDVSGIKIWQWRKVHQCLRLFMDIPKVSVEEKRLRELGKDCGEITHGVYAFSDPNNPSKVKELVRYWTKDPVHELLQSLEGMMNGHGISPSEIKYIHVVHGGDHGKNKFRFATKVVLCMSDGTLYSDVFGIADVACKKDHPIILENTIMPVLIDGINSIYDSDLLFSYSSATNEKGMGETTTLNLSLGLKEKNDTNTFSLKPTSFLAGDLAYLAVMMGKTNFSSAWCNWCKIPKEGWQDPCTVESAMLWDIDEIKRQDEINKLNGHKETKMMGVRGSPMLKIPFSNIIFSGLHAGIGIGNRIIAHLEAFIDIDIEKISHEEFQLRESKRNAEEEIKQMRNQKQTWNQSPTGGRLLDKSRNRIKRIDIELRRNENQNEAATAMISEKATLESKVLTLIVDRQTITKHISRLETTIRHANESLDKYSKHRRGGEESVYTAVDRIFQKFGANRAHYFGRAFEGVDIRKIMSSSDELFGAGGEIRDMMLQCHASDEKIKDKINNICEDVGLAFKLWDGAFSSIHSSDTSQEHCDNTQEIINKAMCQLRLMGISITPKMHGMECHVVNQMRTIPGGIGRLMEHWIEQYHQIGFRFDMSYCRAGTLKGQADIRSSAEKRGRNPRVQMCKRMLQDRYEGKRKKRVSAAENYKQSLKVKQERRNSALAQFYVKFQSNKSSSLLDQEHINEVVQVLDELEDLEEHDEVETEVFGEIRE